MNTNKSISVTLLGKGDLCVQIADWFFANHGYSVCRVVPVVPEPSWCPSLTQWAKDKGIEVVNSGDYRDITGKIDLAFSIFYEKIISQPFIDKCNKIINLHNSPLPKYRGVRPINWALKNREKYHGVTMHEITQGIDDGPIYGQLIYPLYPDIEEVEDVYEKSKKYGWDLFKEVLPRIDSITPYEQKHEEATYYSNETIKNLGNRSDFKR